MEDAANLARMESGEFDASIFLAAPAGDDLWDLVVMAGRSMRGWRRRWRRRSRRLWRGMRLSWRRGLTFYHKHHILSEEDAEKRAFLLPLTAFVREQLVAALALLGIPAPEMM